MEILIVFRHTVVTHMVSTVAMALTVLTAAGFGNEILSLESKSLTFLFIFEDSVVQLYHTTL
jgi:hypothetical protein